MGLLARLRGRRSPAVWKAEMRLLHRLGYVRPPVAVQWIMTNACDLKCPHCYSHAGRRNGDELSTDEAKRLIIDELVTLERPNLVLAGGEPLLRPDFDELVAYAHQRGVPWSLHTHGGWVHRHLDAFRDHPPVMVAVSLDGPREYHDAFRGKRGSFDTACRAIRLLKDAGVPEVVAGMTVTRGNADLVADMLPMIIGTGADSWGLHLMTPEGRAGEHRELLATPAQLRRVAAFARRARSVFHIELDNEWGGAGDDDCYYRDDPFICGAGRFSCVVAVDGELMPCTTTDRNESAGNVRQSPLGQLWADGFAAFRGCGDASRRETGDCWLQTRHGCSSRAPAFAWDLFDARLESVGDARSVATPLSIGATG